MMDAGRHPLIEVITNAEVTGMSGGPGDFRVQVRKHPRYVDEEKCVACGQCVEACHIVQGNEFDYNLKARKAIYRPFPQSVPAAYVIDMDHCKKCWRCVKVCEPEAIDFDMPARDYEFEVGSIIIAAGFQEFDASALGNYGYARFPNVITSLELERMLNASGVTKGHIVRPSDQQTPRSILFIQCVGARGEGGRPYCSRFCCMNAVKDSLLIRQHDPEVEDITILYTDLRAFGKGFDDFVRRSFDEQSAHYLRGRPSKIEEEPGSQNLTVFVEDTLEHQLKRVPADLVVLSLAAAPSDGAQALAAMLEVGTDQYGFIARRDPAVSAVETARDGIYVCGSAAGPQVIPDCVAQASAAAARAQMFLTGSRSADEKQEVEPLDLSGSPRVGVLVCHCGINISGVLDIDDLTASAAQIDGVVVAAEHQFACSSVGQDKLIELVKEHRLNRVVVAACTPRTHEPVFQETLSGIGFNPYLLEMVNIRDQCSWVHATQPQEAQQKARTLIRMGVARAKNLKPLMEGKSPMTRAALVIGGGIAGIQAATDLAWQGFPVVLVEKTGELGGRLRAPNLKYLYPTMQPAEKVLKQKLMRLKDSGARVLLNSEVEDITGYVGNFEATLSGAVDEKIQIGAVILATGADLYDPAGEFGYGRLTGVITSEELEQRLCHKPAAVQVNGAPPRSAAIILCVGSRDEECFSGCSRYCCPTGIKQAILLSEQGSDVTVFYRDIRTVSIGAEEMYRKARGLGVLFVRIPDGRKPEVLGTEKVTGVRCYDALLDRTLEVEADLLVLGVGMRPLEPETSKFHDILKASLGLDGFFLERHPELAPVETSVEGVLIAGTVQGPKDIVDTVAQASAAAAKATVFLAHDQVRLNPTVAVVDAEKCRGCGCCAEICQFQAPKLVDDGSGVFIAEINASLCKGCGTCASWCPSGAISAQHFTDRQVHAMIDAFFETEAAR
ncbi:CoB--CoM heterodisulfide reductase iron-sulfur subunit A family protein [bacterium]|nr:CoB--CoM heterodisulfide reductase iron-sulfur subunit A family protein [bacterium]